MGNGLARKLFVSLGVGLVVALIVGTLAVFLLGRPPQSIRMAAGQQGGMYETFATALKLQLAREGYEVTVLETAGSVENAELLLDGRADIGLVQSGTELLTEMGGSTALSEVFYEPFWLFARAGAIPLGEDATRFADKRIAVGLPGSGTHATATTLLQQTGAGAIPVELASSDAVQALKDGTIDGAFFVVSANAPLIQELVSIPGIEMIPVSNAQGLARRLPFLSPVMLYRGVLQPAAPVMPPEDMEMLAARATLLGRAGLHPDLARLIVREIPDALPVPYVGGLDAFPSLHGTAFSVNEDARTFLDEGPTPLEAFLPFEIASPLSRIYLILLPLLVILFPLYTIVKASWDWFNNSRVLSWYPRINAIERSLERSSLSELMAQQDFLLSLDSRLATQKRVPAGYMATLYDLRIDAAFVRRRVEERIKAVGGDEALAQAMANDAEVPQDPRSISDAAMGITQVQPPRDPG
jgi:TRAP-type uncharacterized transport system substrate-binding protein